MKSFREIRKELKNKGIEIVAQKATLNGYQAYKVKNSELNSAALLTAGDIVVAYYDARL